MIRDDDERLARAARLLRQRRHLRRCDMVARGSSRHFGRLLEAGQAGNLRLDDIRNHFAQLGARVRLQVSWNGAAIDQLLDARHAGLVEAAIVVERGLGWACETEVTFSDFGERGSIDIFAALPAARAVLVNEIKSEWGSMEETLRRLNVKTRLAPKIAITTFGFRPNVVGRVLVLPETSAARRGAAQHSATLAVALPDRNIAVRSWLRNPDVPLRGLWFLSGVHAGGRGTERAGH